MLNVPIEIQELFKQDSISKNFRVTFPNGEYRDLVNADFVSESVVFTESISSDGTLKFGETESSVMEFQTYFDTELRHKYIQCFIEIDISSLSESLQELYGQTSSDVPFVYYSLPYGKFLIESSKRTDSSGIRKVIAYSDRISKLSNMYLGLPEVLCAKLLWGLRIFNAYARDYERYTSKFHINDGNTTSILFSKFLAGCSNSCKFLGEPEMVYDSDSLVFNDSNWPYDVANPTGKIRCLSHTTMRTSRVPSSSQVVCETDNTVYKICVKGKRVVFGDSKVSYYQLYNNNGVRFPMEQSYTKDIYNLPYTLDDSENKIYEMSWDDNVSELSEADFEYPYVWERLHDILPDLLKPSIRFVDWPTVAGYDPLSATVKVTTTDAHIFPLSVNRKSTVGKYSPVNIIPRKYVFGNVAQSYKRVNPDIPNDVSEYHTKFAKLDDGTAEAFTYTPYSDSPNFNDDIQRANCNLSQRYVDIDVKTNGNHHSIVIDPSILVPDNVDLDDVDVQKSLYLRYFDTHGNDTEVNGDIPNGTEPYARKQHLELFIPTDLVIVRAKCPHERFICEGSSSVSTDPVELLKTQCTKAFAAFTDYEGLKNETYNQYVHGYSTRYQEIHVRDIYNPVLQQYDATNSEFLDLKLILDYGFCNSCSNADLGDNYSTNINKNNAPQYPSTSGLPGTAYTFTGYSPVKYPFSGQNTWDNRKIPPEDLPESFYSSRLSELFSAFSELTGQIVRLSRYDDSVEFCKISTGEYHNGETIPLLPGESTLPSVSVAPNTPEVKYLGDILQPGDNTLPSTSIYPSQPYFPGYVITPSDWRKVFIDDYSENVFYDKVSYTGEIGGEEVTISADVPIIKIPEANYITYDLSNNLILTNYTLSAEQIQDIVDNLAVTLSEIVYRKLNMTKRGLPFLEPGDLISIVDTSRTNATISCILKQRISGIQSLITTVENR